MDIIYEYIEILASRGIKLDIEIPKPNDENYLEKIDEIKTMLISRLYESKQYEINIALGITEVETSYVHGLDEDIRKREIERRCLEIDEKYHIPSRRYSERKYKQPISREDMDELNKKSEEVLARFDKWHADIFGKMLVVTRGL